MNMTREEAIKVTSIELVEKVEGENVDFTNRVTDNGHTEFSASVTFEDEDGQGTLTMLVLVPDEEVAAHDELDGIDWEKYISEAEYQVY